MMERKNCCRSERVLWESWCIDPDGGFTRDTGVIGILSQNNDLIDARHGTVSQAYDGDLQMIDSSSIRVHQHGANVKKRA
jgi:hypothetical protein